MKRNKKKKAARRRKIKKALAYVLGSAVRRGGKKKNPRRRPARRKKTVRYAIVRGSKTNPSPVIAGLTGAAAQQAVTALASHFGKGHKIRKVRMK